MCSEATARDELFFSPADGTVNQLMNNAVLFGHQTVCFSNLGYNKFICSPWML
jgi:hypothetical protein